MPMTADEKAAATPLAPGVFRLAAHLWLFPSINMLFSSPYPIAALNHVR